MRSRLLLFAALVGCGASVPRAEVGAPRAPAVEVRVPAPIADGDVERRYRADPSQSRLEVHAWTLMTGWQRIAFRTWSARVVRRRDAVRVEVDVDLRTLSVALGEPATSVVKESLLEVEKYPRGTLTGTVHAVGGGPVPDDGEIMVEGNAELHGIRKAIRFVGTVRREREIYRFRTKFLLSRLDFDIAFHDGWDSFLGDDVRVVIDVVGREEKVSVEALDAPLPAPPR